MTLRLKRMLRSLFKPKSLDAKLVDALRTHCSSLMFKRDECVVFAPFVGMFGPVRMWGATNPTFEFQAYDYERKEYMIIRAEISSPDRIRLYSRTADEGYISNDDGSPIPTPNDHVATFYAFIRQITAYFPLLPDHKVKKGPHELPKELKELQIQGGQSPGDEEVPGPSSASDDGGDRHDQDHSSVLS